MLGNASMLNVFSLTVKLPFCWGEWPIYIKTKVAYYMRKLTLSKQKLPLLKYGLFSIIYLPCQLRIRPRHDYAKIEETTVSAIPDFKPHWHYS